MRYGIHATVRFDQDVWSWISEQALKHVEWCRSFDIEVDLPDAIGDSVDTELEGFASRDWIKVSLACRLLGFDDLTANFSDRSGTEGCRVVEVVFRPSLWQWLVQQAGGDEISGLVNQLLANARVVDWGLYGRMEELVGDSDCFVRQDGPPENALELCERLLGPWDEVDETDSQAGATDVEGRMNK